MERSLLKLVKSPKLVEITYSRKNVRERRAIFIIHEASSSDPRPEEEEVEAVSTRGTSSSVNLKYLTSG